MLGKIILYCLVFILPALFIRCEDKKPETLINTAHLDHLYEEYSINGDTAAFIWIYAEYPEYHVTGAADEGIACVDDAARAAVFYLRYYNYSGQPQSLSKAKKLLHFLMHMQAENGLFYNFIDENRAIITTTINSRPEPNWWTWRAMWAVGEAMDCNAFPADFRKKLEDVYRRALPAVYKLMETYPHTEEIQGLKSPTWLPLNYAADQAAVIIYALLPYYKIHPDDKIKTLLIRLTEGMMMMQAGSEDQFPFDAFLSWQNIWHAYGNAQSDALLSVTAVLYDDAMESAALKEIGRFFPFLIEKQYLNRFSVRKEQDQWQIDEAVQFEQIAYGIRPITFASIKAFQATKDSIFLRQAVEAAAWLFGKNAAGERIYDPKTGRCFDGINSPNEINYNSGAESTIEALLTLLEIEKNHHLDLLYKTINTHEAK
ncbi:MAG: hypothetical protein JXR46_14910 [Calditrichaceae bacterium]|nr:hypothetical protein [Calditrichaceae bacterium]